MKRTIDNARPGCVEENSRQVQMHLVWLRERAIRRDQHSRHNGFGYVQPAIAECDSLDAECDWQREVRDE